MFVEALFGNMRERESYVSKRTIYNWTVEYAQEKFGYEAIQ